MSRVLLASAMPVRAQTTDPETAPVRLGPFGITPALVLRDLGRDTNVFNERDNPKSDFTLTVVPRLEGCSGLPSILVGRPS
jgi:hypothetical protein